MASIARKNLFEDIPRFLVAQAGIMFAVSLVTIQFGIFKGFSRSTALLVDQSSADLWVGAAEMVHLELTLPIPVERLAQARKVPGVARAEGLSVRSALWRSTNGKIAPVRMFGFNPNGQLFSPGNITQGTLSNLTQPYTILLDESNMDSLNLKQLNDSGAIASLKTRVVGTTQGTQSIASSTYVFTSLESANAYFTSGLNPTVNCKLQTGDLQCTSIYEVPLTSDGSVNDAPPPPERLNLNDAITYVLVQAEPGQDLQALKRSLEAALPGTRALTREEMADQTRSYWLNRTGIGFILGLGAMVGVVVGMVIVSQILYSSVADHLQEFGTLKAMGASDWVIYSIILEQALWMAVLGYLPGMALCLGLGVWTMTTQGIVILITPTSAIVVFGVTVLMCASSALFAIQKVTHVDPAIVFKA